MIFLLTLYSTVFVLENAQIVQNKQNDLLDLRIQNLFLH